MPTSYEYNGESFKKSKILWVFFPWLNLDMQNCIVLELQKDIAYYAVYLSVIDIVNKMVVDAIKFVYISFIKTLIFKVVEK